MVKTIFDLANSFGDNGIWFWYFFFVILIGIWANSKNRNYWKWMGAALLFSPLLTGLVLLFSGKIEKKEDIVKNKRNKKSKEIGIPSFKNFIGSLLLIIILIFIFGGLMAILSGIIISEIKNVFIGIAILFISLLILYILNREYNWFNIKKFYEKLK